MSGADVVVRYLEICIGAAGPVTPKVSIKQIYPTTGRRAVGSPFTEVHLPRAFCKPRFPTAWLLTKCVRAARDVIRAIFCRHLAWSGTTRASAEEKTVARLRSSTRLSVPRDATAQFDRLKFADHDGAMRCVATSPVLPRPAIPLVDASRGGGAKLPPFARDLSRSRDLGDLGGAFSRTGTPFALDPRRPMGVVPPRHVPAATRIATCERKFRPNIATSSNLES